MCQAMLWPIQQILLLGRKGRNDLAFKWEFWKARSPEMVPSATTCCYQEAQGCLIILTFSTLSHNSYPSTIALLLVLAPRLAKSLDESIQLFTIKNHSFLPFCSRMLKMLPQESTKGKSKLRSAQWEAVRWKRTFSALQPQLSHTILV